MQFLHHLFFFYKFQKMGMTPWPAEHAMQAAQQAAQVNVLQVTPSTRTTKNKFLGRCIPTEVVRSVSDGLWIGARTDRLCQRHNHRTSVCGKEEEPCSFSVEKRTPMAKN